MAHDAEKGCITQHLILIPLKYPQNAVLRGAARSESKLGFVLHVTRWGWVGWGGGSGGHSRCGRPSRSCEGALAQNLTYLLANSQEVAHHCQPNPRHARPRSHMCTGADACQNARACVWLCVFVLIFEQLRSGWRCTMTDSEVLREPRGSGRGKRTLGRSTTQKKEKAAEEGLKLCQIHVDGAVM